MIFGDASLGKMQSACPTKEPKTAKLYFKINIIYKTPDLQPLLLNYLPSPQINGSQDPRFK